ncbi:MAG: sulfatase-like hydrolase/transferase [Thalassotalea sp.]
MKNIKLNPFLILGTMLLANNCFANTEQPNILWIITDDHRPDSIQAYNRATTGKSEGSLGYVSSPNIDQLASEGVLFTQVFNQSPACGPSRTSMHSGRYPFRSGKYAWEHVHQETDFANRQCHKV